MDRLSRERAIAFWCVVRQDIAVGNRALVVAVDAFGVCGTVQLLLHQPENQPHFATLVKLLVHRRARRRGIGTALIKAAEASARDSDRTLLVLVAARNSEAAHLYDRLGWLRVGDIPGYALFPGGDRCDATVFYRNLNDQSG
jgi:ribosomal protein S18 acetylase RimI-like enzyme